MADIGCMDMMIRTNMRVAFRGMYSMYPSLSGVHTEATV